MMEWEKLNDNFSSLSVGTDSWNLSALQQQEQTNANPFSSALLSTKTNFSMTNTKKTKMDKTQDNENVCCSLGLTGGLLNDTDVLLIVTKKNQAIRKFVPGTTSYWTQIYQHRPMYQQYAKNNENRKQIVQQIAESIWEQDGRFLAFHEGSGSISTINKNDIVFAQIHKDLCKPMGRAPKSNMTKRRRIKKNNKNNAATNQKEQGQRNSTKKTKIVHTKKVSNSKRRKNQK